MEIEEAAWRTAQLLRQNALDITIEATMTGILAALPISHRLFHHWPGMRHSSKIESG